MRIPRNYGLSLVANGSAREEGVTADKDHDGCYYVILTRFDEQRTDHYPATDEDLTRLEAAEAEAEARMVADALLGG